jgi:crossover junction endodeoxyribonuclease RusA
MSTITFFVPGTPKPGGSKRHVGNGILIDSSGQAGKDWRGDVKVYAQQAYKGEPLTGPLEVEFHFVRQWPKSFLRADGGIKPSRHGAKPTTNPDTTKLIRSVEDALTGILWADDSQIVRQWGSKVYGTKPGVEIVVKEIN